MGTHGCPAVTGLASAGCPDVLAAAVAALSLLALPAAAQAAKAKPSYYVSLGDSYAAGYQRLAADRGRHPRRVRLPAGRAKASKRGYDLKLVNFGCGGRRPALDPQAQDEVRRRSAPAASNYAGQTQATAAAKFLRKHTRPGRADHRLDRRQRRDLLRQGAPTRSPASADAMEKVKANGKVLLKRLRKAAGPKTRIVGITYPDVILGAWVGATRNQDLAQALGRRLPVAAQPGAEGDVRVGRRRASSTSRRPPAHTRRSSRRRRWRPTARSRSPVAEVCELTWLLRVPGHPPERKGYEIIADLIAATLPHKH